MRTPRTHRKQPPPILSEGAMPRCSSLPPMSPPPPPMSPPPPPPCTPGWSASPPASPSSNKGLARSGGSLGPVQPPVRRSLRLSATTPAADGDSAPVAERVPALRSSVRGRPRRGGAGVRGGLARGGAAGDGAAAAGEGEAGEFRVSGSSGAKCYMNLRSGAKIARRAIVEKSSDRGIATRGGDPSKAGVEDVVVDLTDATVEVPEEDAVAFNKGRKRGRPKGRNAPEMGAPLGKDAPPSPVFSEEYDDRSGTVEGIVGDDFVNASDQISVLACDVKQEDKASCEYLSLRSGSILRRKSTGVVSSQVQIAESETKFDAPEKDRGSLIIGWNGRTMEDDSGVGETSAAKTKGKNILVVEEDGNEISIKMDVDISAGKDAGKHLGKTDGLEGDNDSGMKFASRREADRARAMALASKFAFFEEDVIGEDDEEALEEGEEPKELVLDSGDEDWPGPFSTAMKIIRERDEKLRARNLSSSSKKVECTEVGISWKPSESNRRKPLVGSCPTLKHICMKLLVEHADEIESLEGIPDGLRNRLILMLCCARKMSYRLLDILVGNSCSEIHLSDCSWATENQFEEIFTKCNTNLLKVVRLDLSGRCMPDYILRTTLARSPNSLPMLTSLSLKGSYRLSDNGLNAIVSSAPSLRSINLSQCSLVTSIGIINLVGSMDGVLRELYIDDCYNVDAMVILPALKKLKHLEVLSLGGVQSVCHKFVRGLIPSCGSNMREFGLAGCWKVTDSSIKTISEHCPSLRVIDLRNLSQLTDCALKHLANGCQSLQTLKLRQTAFSDGAVAAFLEASGRSLIELTLNNVKEVAEHTALAISRQCSTLQNLDLSFCREMTNEALGIIVDKCLCLRVLKLFGCTQVTDLFLNGHSNCEVKIIGLKGQVLHEIEMPDFL